MNARIYLSWLWSTVLAISQSWAAPASDGSFTLDSDFLKLPAGVSTVGDSHGDVAVSPAGEIFISVEGGERSGIQVYSAEGTYLRNLPNAPNDLHGFVIAAPGGADPSIYGASLRGERIVQLTLDGELLLNIAAASIPDTFKTRNLERLFVALTGVAVAANGDIYAVDGYARDFIHRFDKAGRYVGSFGGKEQPWGFDCCHKIMIDSRFEPERLLCADRFHNRLIHMDLEGRVLGVFAEGLRWPSALAAYKSELAVAELGGRVTILDLQGKIVASIGSNSVAIQTKTNRIPPERWQPQLFYSPHGIAYTGGGDLLVSEWNQWGRVVRVNRPSTARALHQ